MSIQLNFTPEGKLEVGTNKSMEAVQIPYPVEKLVQRDVPYPVEQIVERVLDRPCPLKTLLYFLCCFFRFCPKDL